MPRSEDAHATLLDDMSSNMQKRGQGCVPKLPKLREHDTASMPSVVSGHRFHKYTQHDDRYTYIGKDVDTREPLFLDYGRVVKATTISSARLQTSRNQCDEPDSEDDNGSMAGIATRNLRNDDYDDAGSTLVSGWEYAEDEDQYIYIGSDEDTSELEFLENGQGQNFDEYNDINAYGNGDEYDSSSDQDTDSVEGPQEEDVCEDEQSGISRFEEEDSSEESDDEDDIFWEYYGGGSFSD